jgi:hypothetical protein
MAVTSCPECNETFFTREQWQRHNLLTHMAKALVEPRLTLPDAASGGFDPLGLNNPPDLNPPGFSPGFNPSGFNPTTTT